MAGFGMDDMDMSEMWDMFMSMGGADGFMAMDGGGFGKGKGKGKGKDFGGGKGKDFGGKGKKCGKDFGGDFGGFGDFDGGMKGKGKGKMMMGGKPMIDPKVAAAIEQCIAEIEERENGGGAGDMAIATMDPMDINATGGGDPDIMKSAQMSSHTQAAQPSGGGGGGDGMPDIKRIEVAPGGLTNEGFAPGSFGVEFSKEHTIFSESHTILNDLLFVPGKYDLTWQVEFSHDSDANTYPEVYQAWMAAGGSENLPCVARVKELGKWAVGFGGKKNAERAAKLALSIAIALDSEHAAQVIARHPGFGRILQLVGGLNVATPGNPPAFSPY